MKTLPKWTLFLLFLITFESLSCKNPSGGPDKKMQKPETFSVFFYSNDGRNFFLEQEFIKDVPQNLQKNIWQRKDYYFIGWGISRDAVDVSYYDEELYTGTERIQLYALWSPVPAYKINIQENPNGHVFSSKYTAKAGTLVALSSSPNAGYSFCSYSVVDENSNPISLNISNQFIMPQKNVTVSAVFNPIDYEITIGSSDFGTIIASTETAVVGSEIILTITPDSDYKLESIYVVATDGSNIQNTGEGNVRKFIMPAQSVTVNATYKIIAASGEYTVLPSGTHVTFGLWPQTIKSADVIVNETKTKKVGMFTYYKGSDGEWYVKVQEKAYSSNYKYSDGTTVGTEANNSFKYFKVEPIKWRVQYTLKFTKGDSSGNFIPYEQKVLLSEYIIDKCVFYDAYYGTGTMSNTVPAPNNYRKSRIRAYLNGLSYTKRDRLMKEVEGGNEFKNKGFSQTVFTEEEKKIIKHESSMSMKITTYDQDIIFLYSKDNLENSKWGFTDDTERGKTCTDFSLARGAIIYEHPWGSSCYYGSWWTCSPETSGSRRVYRVSSGGVIDESNSYVDDEGIGVVPAVIIEKLR